MTTPTGSTPSAIRFHWGWWVAVVFALQGAGLWWLSRNTTAPRPSANPAPLLLANTDSAGLLEALALEDPTAFARPNPNGFSGPSLRPGTMPHQPHRWQPPEIDIPYPTNLLTGPIDSILKTNLGDSANAFVKPMPKIMVLNVPPLEMQTASRTQTARIAQVENVESHHAAAAHAGAGDGESRRAGVQRGAFGRLGPRAGGCDGAGIGAASDSVCESHQRTRRAAGSFQLHHGRFDFSLAHESIDGH